MNRLRLQLGIALAVLVFVLGHPRQAEAIPVPPPEDSAGWIWTPMWLYRQVKAEELGSTAPFVPRRTPVGMSPVTVATKMGALVWVDGMTTIRVRKADPDGPGRLRFRRLDIGRSALALVDDPAVAAGNGTWFITQPTPSGSAWLIEADHPTTISIDEPRPREGRLIWEHVEDRIWAWIEGKGDFPELPPVEGRSAFRTRVFAHRQVAEAILEAGRDDEHLQAALFAWRRAHALQELARIGPLVRPSYVSRRVRRRDKVPVDLPHLNALVEVGETAAHPYFRLGDGEAWHLETRGPAVLRLTVRALFLEPVIEDRVLHVSVLADGREIDRLDVRLRPSSVRDPSSNTQPIPIYTDAITEHGDRTSRPVVLSVPLLVGVHDYTIRVTGGPSIAKARLVTRNYRTASLAAGHSPRAQLRMGLKHLRKTADRRAEIVRWLLLRLQFGDPGTVDLDPLSNADPLVANWIAATALEEKTDPVALRAAATELADQLSSRFSPSALEQDLRWHLFLRLHAAGRPDLASSLLIERVHQLNSDAFVGLILALPNETDIAPVAKALEIVARGIPLDNSLRRAHLELWRYTSWDRLSPRLGDGQEESWTWIAIDESPKDEGIVPTEPEPGVLWSMRPGAIHDLQVQNDHLSDNTILSTVVITPDDESGPVALRIDGRRWETLVVDPAARFETLLPSGEHQLQVDGPRGTHVFTSLPTHPRGPLAASPPQPDETGDATAVGPPEPGGTRRQMARRHRLWPLPRRRGNLRFDLEPPQVGTLLRVDLRAVPWAPFVPTDGGPQAVTSSQPTPDPSRIRVHTNYGPASLVLFKPGQVDPLTIPEEAPGAASDRVSLLFRLEPGTAWIEIENVGDDDLAAAAYVRRWEAPKPPPVPEPGDETTQTDVLEQIARLGRAIVQDPNNPDLLLQRAHLLLSVDAVGQAQQDHDRVLELLNEAWDESIARRLQSLAASIDRQRSRTAFEIHDPSLRDQPLLLAPPLAAVARGPNLAAWAIAAMTLRRREMGRWAGDSTTTVARALAAVTAERAGRYDRAGFLWSELYAETHSIAVGLAAAGQFRAALDRGQRTHPAFAFGFVRALQKRIDSPRLRRLAALAARQSRWIGLRYVDASAGMQRLGTPVGPDTDPDEASAWLLVLSPPWEPTEDNVLRPGTTMVMDLPPISAQFEVFCQAVRGPKANHPGSSRTGLDVILDGKLVAHHEIASGMLVQHQVEPTSPTGHRLSFRLEDEDPRFLCSVHRPARASVTPVLETRQWLTARPQQPVRASVLGPTVLRLDLRHGAAHLRRPMEVFIKLQHGASVRTESVTLSPDVDSEAAFTAGMRRPLGANVRTEILIPEPGPVTVTIEPGFAQVLARIAVRESLPLPAPGPLQEAPASPPAYPKLRARIADLGAPYWPGTPPVVLDHSITDPSKLTHNRLGALQAELTVGRDDIAEFDQFRPRLRVRNALTWRRELIRSHLWIRAGAAGQWRDLSGLAGGVDSRVYGQFGPRRLRGTAGASSWFEGVAGQPEWSARFLVSLDWPVQVAPRVALIPELTTTYRHQSLTIGEARDLREGVHPEVYSNYVEQHPLVFTPSLITRIRPLQDQLISLGVSTTPNSDFRSNERTDMDLRILGVVDTRKALLFLYRTGYQASLRFADEDRPDFYVRNRLRAGFEFTYLFIGAGRLTLSVQDSVYLSRPYAAQNVVEFTLSFDLSVGRGIRDTSPMELLFRNLYELRWWKQGEEDDLL